jgi:hypothetical protein
MVVGGEEVPLFQMKRNGLLDLVVRPDEAGGMCTFYTTSVSNIAKIFVQDRTGDHRRWFSFYFKIKGKNAALVTIRPFPNMHGDHEFDTGFFFRARGNFLTKNEALEILSPESPSVGYLKNQRLLPVPLLQKMVTIDRNVLREGVRVIRIGAKK